MKKLIFVLEVTSWLAVFLLCSVNNTGYKGDFDTFVIIACAIIIYWAVCQLVTAWFAGSRKDVQEQQDEPFIEEIEAPELEKNYSYEFQQLYDQIMSKEKTKK